MTKHRLTPLAKTLRRNQTIFEDKLWQEIRAKRLGGFKFKRQVPFGNYIADFVCHTARLVVELDGVQHLNQTEADKTRDEFMRESGFHVIRVMNADISDNLEGVCEELLAHLERRTTM